MESYIVLWPSTGRGDEWMTRHYTIPNFFRQVPNAMLWRYFSTRGLLLDFNFNKMPEAKPDALIKAWDGLDDAVRRQIEPDFREIFDLSCEKGFRAIQDEAAFHHGSDLNALSALVEALAKLKSHFARAMTVFLDHHHLWRGATRFHVADLLASWRKWRGLPARPAALDHASRDALSDAIGAWFRQAEGRGRNCHLEVLRRDTRDYFFLYPEDFADERIEWVANQFERKPHTAAFELVFVWSAIDGTLDVHHRGSRKALEAIVKIFAHTILKLDELPPVPRAGVYRLNELKRREFQFVRAPESGIKSVNIRKLRLTSKVRGGSRITVEADRSPDLYDDLEAIGRALPLEQQNVTQAEIVAFVAEPQDKPDQRRTFTLTWPNSCSLKYDETDLKLRAMLAASGIEIR